MLHRLRPAPAGGVTPLLEGAAVTVALGGAAALVALLVSGGAAAAGVLVGAGLVVLVCTGGAFVVASVTRVAPTASLLVALLTYTLQVLLLLVAFVALERSGLLGSRLDREWLGGAVIGATLLWLGTLIAGTVTARIPAYDLGPEAGDR